MRKVLSILLFIGVLACAEKVIEPPKDLIGEEKMTDILYDLALLNSIKSTNIQILEKHQIELMPYLFEKYDIDSIQFTESDLYYASVPLTYETIYKNVEARLESRIQEINAERERKKDSTDQARKAVKDSLLKVGSNKAPKSVAPLKK